MVRLDTLVAKVLADARRAMEKPGEAQHLPGKGARAEGESYPARLGEGLGCGERLPRSPASHQHAAKPRDTGRPAANLE